MKKILTILFFFILLCGCSNATVPIEMGDTNIFKNRNLISEDELKSYIKRIDITPENWKDILYVNVDYHEEQNNFGETVFDPKEVDVRFEAKPGYIADINEIGLVLYDIDRDYEMNWENLFYDPILYVYLKDGLKMNLRYAEWNYYEGMVVYGIPGNGGFYESAGLFVYPFVMEDTPYTYEGIQLVAFENIICTKAGGHVYQLEIPEELIIENSYVSYISKEGTPCDLPIKDFFYIDSFMNY